MARVSKVSSQKINKKFSQQSLISLGRLTPDDVNFISNRRGAHNKLGIAYQLIFINLLHTPPVQTPFEVIDEIVVYASIQLSIDISYINEYRQNRKKIYDHQQAIFAYLGVTTFNEDGSKALVKFVHDKALQYESISLLKIKAIEYLKSINILLPADDTITRLIKKSRSSARNTMFDSIQQMLSPELLFKLDQMLIVTDGKSTIEFLKSDVKNPSVDTILQIVKRVEIINDSGALGIDLSLMNNNYKRTLSNEIKRCSAPRIKEMQATRKYAALICFLQQAYAAHIDLLISNYVKLVNSAYTRATNEVDKITKKHEESIRESISNYKKMKLVIKDKNIPDIELREELYRRFKDELNDNDNYGGFPKSKSRRIFDVFQKKYSYFRQFMPTVLPLLKLEGNEASKTVDAVEVLKKSDDDSQTRKLPESAPTEFVPKPIKQDVMPNGEIKKSAWELALYLKLKEEIKKDNVSAPESNNYTKISSLNIDDKKWEESSEKFYGNTELPKNSKDVGEYLSSRLDHAYDQYLESWKTNKYAKVNNGKWSLSKDEALPMDDSKKDEIIRLRKWLDKNLRQAKLPDLLVEVDNELSFTEPLLSQSAVQLSHIENVYSVLAAVLAHACNIGLYTMPKMLSGISYTRLQSVTDWQLTDDALRTSLSWVVNAISKIGVTEHWGKGKTSSSDAHLKTFKESVSTQSYHPAFGDFALAFYTFIADNYAPFFSKSIECNEGEAPHVLDGHLYNESDLTFEEHFTDTRSAATTTFTAFAWFGKKYSPRIRGIQKYNIYKIKNERDYGVLSPLLEHRNAQIDVSIIESQWDEMAKFYASIEQGKITASVALRRLLSLSKKSNFYKANLLLGRVLRTEHILQHMSDPEYRRKKHRGLLKGEQIHQLARNINYANRGKITSRSAEAQDLSCNCLTLVIAIIIYWQSNEINRLIKTQAFIDEGFDLSLIEYISPADWGNLVLYGEYVINKSDIRG